MSTLHGREGPGAKKRGRGRPGKHTSTPDPKEFAPQSASLNDTLGRAERQTGQYPGGNLSFFSQLSTRPLSLSSDDTYDSGWVWLDTGRRARLTLVGQPDGGIRAAWVGQQLLYSPDSSRDLDDEGDGDTDCGSASAAGSPFPTPPKSPAGSVSVSIMA